MPARRLRNVISPHDFKLFELFLLDCLAFFFSTESTPPFQAFVMPTRYLRDMVTYHDHIISSLHHLTDAINHHHHLHHIFINMKSSLNRLVDSSTDAFTLQTWRGGDKAQSLYHHHHYHYQLHHHHHNQLHHHQNVGSNWGKEQIIGFVCIWVHYVYVYVCIYVR